MKKITFLVLLLIVSPVVLAKNNPPLIPGASALLSVLPDFSELLTALPIVGGFILVVAAAVAIYKTIRALIFS